MRQFTRHRLGLLIPALAWLFVQFSMSGVVLAETSDGVTVEICSAFGIQEVQIDPATGQPVTSVAAHGCDWCHSFGVAITLEPRADVAWVAIAQDFQYGLALAPVPHHPLRLAADFRSRAPPVL